MINICLCLYNWLTFFIVSLLKYINFFILKSDIIYARTLTDASHIPLKKTSIWVHCASLGETISISSLLIELNKQYPNYDIILTSHTKTSKEFVENNLFSVAKHMYCPFDNKYIIKRFIQLINPKLAIWIDQEFLPATLTTLKTYNIPVVLLNARMSDKSFKTWSKVSYITKYLISLFSVISASSVEDQKKYQKFSLNKILYLENLKNTVDPQLTYDFKIASIIKKYFQNNIIFTAVSTHSNEEEIIYNVHKKIYSKFSRFTTFIIPRHIERSNEIISNLQDKYNISIPLFSTLNLKNTTFKNSKYNFILVDKIGKVSTFLSLSNIAFVGKSLSSKHFGGHNLNEAITSRCPVLFGSNISNFQSQANDIIKHEAGIEIQNQDELYSTLITLVNNPSKLLAMKTNCLSLIPDPKENLQLFINIINPFLEKK